jgi:Arc/MetJ-type ribon-helix-helix transcriptional regulator
MMNNKKSNIEVISVRLSKELVNVVDSLIRSGIYSSRSEAIREFLRDYALEKKKP